MTHLLTSYFPHMFQRLQQENRQLSEENKATTERLQAAPVSNGNSNENGPSLSLAEHERM